jgi:ketosteroid isomerase-like protein
MWGDEGMATTQALETVARYFDLWSQKDYQGSRAYLADDLQFKGPFDTFRRADDLIRAVSRLGPIIKEIRSRKIFVDDRSVCVVYDMVTSTEADTVSIAEVFEVESGKITSILAFFDPRPFVPLFAGIAPA